MPIWKATVSIANAALGGQGSNTWHCRTTAILGEVEVDEELQNQTDMFHDFYTNLNDVICGGTTIDFDGQWLTVDEDEPGLLNVEPFSVGITGSSAPLPPQDCLVVGWRTSSPTRGGRGRTFVGPLKAAVLQDNGTPAEASLDTIRLVASQLVDDSMALNTGALGVYSRAGATSEENGILRDFIGSGVRNQFGVLRSRRD